MDLLTTLVLGGFTWLGKTGITGWWHHKTVLEAQGLKDAEQTCNETHDCELRDQIIRKIYHIKVTKKLKKEEEAAP